jgi:hypothetical protein
MARSPGVKGVALASCGRLVGEAGVEGPVEVDADGVGKGVGSTGERFIQ